MRLQILSRYGRKGASSRVRMFQYVPWLEAHGWDVSIAPFFDDAYLTAQYAGEGTRSQVAAAYARRLGQLRARPKPDLIWLEKEALPMIPAAIERRLLPARTPIVADYDDAVFHSYDLHPRAAVRRVLGQKIDRIMQHASLVLAGNEYLAVRAKSAGASHVEIVPTVVDADAYRTPSAPRSDTATRIGWVGTPSTWRESLVPMLPLLTTLAEQHGARITVIGSGARDVHPLVDTLEWSEAAEIDQIHGFDIGIMPLNETPWALGKCGYKLIQYMACAKPVVASPVGVNREIVEHGVNGFLADSSEDWRIALERLLRDRDLRSTMGAVGCRKVLQRYSLQSQQERVSSLLAACVEGID